jgi:hypothetical protein
MPFPGLLLIHLFLDTGSKGLASFYHHNMACEEKSRLLAEFDQAVQAYGAAVRQLNQNRPTSSKWTYDELNRAAETARLKCEDARLALDRHRAGHRC